MMLRDLPSEIAHSIRAVELDRLLSLTNEAVVYVDADWIVRYCNDVYVRNLGLRRAEIEGRTPFDYHPAFRRSIFYEAIETCRQQRKPMVRIGYSTVLQRWLMARVFPAGDGMLMLANDASESGVRQHELAQQALKDSLTGLPNKLALVEEMQSRLTRDEPFFLAVIGLHRLRVINDTQGYAAGDIALMEMASRMQSVTQGGEVLYRLSGDEFALISPAQDAFARERASALQAQAREPVRPNGTAFVLGAAVGGVLAPAHGGEPEQLLKRAALALHSAARTHKDDLLLYEPRLEMASRLRFDLEAELRHAIDGDELMLMLQPKGCLARHHVVGAEALIRWNHPERGMVPPADFLPLAAECQLMRRIDRWVLRQALAHLRELKRQGLAVPLSVNLSVDSLSDVELVDYIRDSLTQAGIQPSLLDIEIPEGALMHDVAISAKVLAGLDELGVGISIDDFGTGYSSFAYLVRFPVHTLKVDRSFVNEMSSSKASREVVKGLIRMAHSLSMRVVAEGAETDQQIAMLEQMQCDEVQGYGYARPMPFDKFCDFVREHRRPTGPDPFVL